MNKFFACYRVSNEIFYWKPKNEWVSDRSEAYLLPRYQASLLVNNLKESTVGHYDETGLQKIDEFFIEEVNSPIQLTLF